MFGAALAALLIAGPMNTIDFLQLRRRQQGIQTCFRPRLIADGYLN